MSMLKGLLYRAEDDDEVMVLVGQAQGMIMAARDATPLQALLEAVREPHRTAPNSSQQLRPSSVKQGAAHREIPDLPRLIVARQCGSSAAQVPRLYAATVSPGLCGLWSTGHPQWRYSVPGVLPVLTANSSAI